MQFPTLSLVASPIFWSALGTKKLNEWKLSEEFVTMKATLSVGKTMLTDNGRLALPSRLILNEDIESETGNVKVHLKVFNKIEDFKSFNKVECLTSFGTELKQSMTEKDELFEAILLVHADLKKHVYQYYFAFVTLVSDLKSTVGEFDCAIDPDWKKSAETVFVISPDGARKRLSEYSPADVVVFIDCSGLSDHAGWPLRNILYYLGAIVGQSTVNVVCIREDSTLKLTVAIEIPSDVKVVGWETAHGKLVPKKIDLSSLMDPSTLAESALNLNLRLMKWRLAPQLDLQKIASQKILLLGSGTLGCNVARCCLGWGIRNLTFVDYGIVSHSNPARQSLFTFQDAVDGTGKAVAAAEAMKRIAPYLNVHGVQLEIPMPGHHMNEEALKDSLAQLEKLIKEHDGIFLLTDSREARWLPSLLGKLHNKIVINSALGFDNLVVMRHGLKNLSCYFCHDIVAPTDSLSNRSLDQQCTVTKPGLSMMASGLAVELFVALLEHSNGDDVQEVDSDKVPHQIRFFQSTWNQVTMTGTAFNQCTACSNSILERYKKEGIEFVRKVLDDSNVLEVTTGLDKMKIAMDDTEIEEIEDL